MRLLLDTQVLLWALTRSERLSETRYAEIVDPENEVLVSAVSPWEIEIKRRARRLRAPEDVLGAVQRAGFRPLSVTGHHGVVAGRLPLHHRDPFDRMLVAQAQVEGLTIITSDRDIPKYQVAVLRA